MRRAQKNLIAAVLSLSAGWTGAVSAEQRPVVVELYTSQGCSSCPPADEIFSQLQGREDVIAIALHVDYWDYIGWKDEFGHPDHAQRQRAYASKAGRRSIYTPEMVVNGKTDIVGAKPMVLSKAIAEHKATAPRMSLDVQRSIGAVSVRGTVPTSGASAMEVHVLQVIPSQSVKITRGENRGKTYEYSNIAHDWQVAGTWNGKAPLDMTLEVSSADPVIVIVQEAGGGPIVAAAQVD